MAYDYGFELPDTRYRFICKDGETCHVRIVRHWFMSEDLDEPDFKVSFDIIKGNQVTKLPVGTDESTAIDIATKLYEVDRDATEEIQETDAIQAAEMRYGA